MELTLLVFVLLRHNKFAFICYCVTMNTFFLIYNTHYVQQNAVLVALCIKIRYLDIWDTNFPPHPRASQTEKSSGVNDVLFMFIHVLFSSVAQYCGFSNVQTAYCRL